MDMAFQFPYPVTEEEENWSARDFLDRPRRIEQEILRTEERVRFLKGLTGLFSARLKAVRVVSSPDPAKTQQLICEITDLEREIPRLKEEHAQAEADILLAASRLPEQCLTDIIEMRYLRRMAWEEISREMMYSPSWTLKLHVRALSLLRPPR